MKLVEFLEAGQRTIMDLQIAHQKQLNALVIEEQELKRAEETLRTYEREAGAA